MQHSISAIQTEPAAPARSGPSRFPSLRSMGDSIRCGRMEANSGTCRSKIAGILCASCARPRIRVGLNFSDRARRASEVGHFTISLTPFHAGFNPIRAGGSDFAYMSFQNHSDPLCACARPRWRVGLNARPSLMLRIGVLRGKDGKVPGVRIGLAELRNTRQLRQRQR